MVYVVDHNEEVVLSHLKFVKCHDKTLGSERNELTSIFRAPMRHLEGVNNKRKQELREVFSFWMEG